MIDLLIHVFHRGHSGWVWGLEQPFPGSPVYFSSSVDETVRVWDLREEKPCVHVISEFHGAVAGISLNWEQQRLVSGGFDVGRFLLLLFFFSFFLFLLSFFSYSTIRSLLPYDSLQNFIRVFDIRNFSKQYKIDPSLERITRVTSNNNRIGKL